jgi:hypothetical protein
MRRTAQDPNLAALCFMLLGVLPLQAQDGGGRADLRYVAGSAVTVTYAGEERSEPGAQPARRLLEIRSVIELSLTPAPDGIAVTAVTTERTTSTGRSQQPPPERFVISERGSPLGDGAPPPDRFHPVMGESPLLLLPGRALRPGESWTDTAQFKAAQDGIDMLVVTRIHGTYERDTVMAGRTLNVIRYTADDVATGSADIRGMRIDVAVHSNRDGTLLWDSVRHLVVESEMRRVTESRAPAPMTNTETVVWRLVP